MSKFLQLVLMLLSIGFLFGLNTSCKKTTDDENDSQPIITTDTSQFNGKLKAEVRTNNNSPDANAVVYVYTSYNDFLNNMPLNYVLTNNSGIADFGYVLQGNYYLFAKNNSNGALTDTAVVQVLSRRETLRIMRLGN